MPRRNMALGNKLTMREMPLLLRFKGTFQRPIIGLLQRQASVAREIPVIEAVIGDKFSRASYFSYKFISIQE